MVLLILDALLLPLLSTIEALQLDALWLNFIFKISSGALGKLLPFFKLKYKNASEPQIFMQKIQPIPLTTTFIKFFILKIFLKEEETLIQIKRF